MRNALVYLVLALGVAAAAVGASLLLLGSTGGNDRVGNLSPLASIPTAPARTVTAPVTTVERPHEAQDD